MINILVVDHDRNLGQLLSEFLNPQGFRVDLAYDRETGIRMAVDRSYSLIIVDVLLPEGDNDFSILQHIRSRSSTPILVLTTRADDGDRIVGLELGADDYLKKPFNPLELLARIRAVLRRTELGGNSGASNQIPKRLKVGDVEMHPGTRVVVRSGNPIPLTSVEFSILEILLRHAGQTVSRGELTQAALGRSFLAYDRSIDVHVSKLRKKLGYRVSGVERIKTIRGQGYLYALTGLSTSDPPG